MYFKIYSYGQHNFHAIGIFKFFTLRFLFESELYITFQVINMINIVFLLTFCWQPIKGFNTSIN